MEDKTKYYFADDEQILLKKEPGEGFKKFVWNSEDDWVPDGELLRMFFGDFKVREVPESEVPELKKIARDWAYLMPDWPDWPPADDPRKCGKQKKDILEKWLKILENS